MERKNEDIRKLLLEYNLKQYQLAEKLKISEWTLIRHLRKELSLKEKEKYVNLINELAKGDNQDE